MKSNKESQCQQVGVNCVSEYCVKQLMCGRQGSPYMWAHGSELSWCPTTSHVLMKVEVSTGK